MVITPGELLDTSMAQLETLAAFLGDQLGDGSEQPEFATAEALACWEILLSLRALILKLAPSLGTGGRPSPVNAWPTLR
jgi:hypothetical protein